MRTINRERHEKNETRDKTKKVRELEREREHGIGDKKNTNKL